MGVRGYCRAIVILALAASNVSAATPDSSPRASLLDVPYLSQTQQLCGGAAVAMVLRYWGERNVLPQDFAALVDASESGIRTSVLTAAVTGRGWQTLVGSAADREPTASAAWLSSEIAKGRPVIALLEVSPRRYHYVVVVGVTASEVVYHDPARAPFRVVPFRSFDEQWAAANRWTLVVLPSTGSAPTLVSNSPAAPREVSPQPKAVTPCSALIASSVALARAGQTDDAERGLLTANSLCPSGGSTQLELGGVRFLQRRYAEAETLAANAIATDVPNDTAWELLATSRYLQGNLLGALEAWNEIGRPRTDVIRIDGVERLDHPVLVKRLGLEARAPLTASAFARAERRLNELPTVKKVALNYFPRSEGTADVVATLSERSVLPRGLAGWAAVGVNPLFRKEVRLLVAAPFRQGETWDIRYRWRANRPRVRVALAAPAPGVLPGILGVEGLWERQSYQPSEQPLREERRRVGVHLSDWLTDRVRWTAGGAADQFESRRFFNVHGELDVRWLNDHVSTIIGGGYWMPTGDDQGFATGRAQVSWRSTRNASAPEWLAQAGVTFVGESAPLALWPIAGSGESRGPLLRAHELHTDGIVVSEIFGRQLAFASLEYQHPVYARKGATVSVAGFTDTGRAWHRPFSSDTSPFHVDVGTGLRISVGDDQLRIDFAYGLRDDRRSISAGYVVPFGQ